MAAKHTYVITGGAGFIGSHLVRALVERGGDVHIVDNFAAGRHEDRIVPEATYHEADIRDYDTLASVFAGADCVFHLAAIPRVQDSIDHPLETMQTNVNGTATVLAAAKAAGVRRVVFASSAAVYGDHETMPLHETLPPRPKSPYGLHKYEGERMCALWSEIYDLPTVSLRYFNTYGPGLDPRGPYALAVGAFLLARQEGRPITIFGDGTVTRDYTHVRDVVRANLLAADSGKVGQGEVINIGAGQQQSIQKLAELVDGEIQYAEPRVEPHDSEADNHLAKELLGWSPAITLEEGIAELKELHGVT